MVSVTFRDFKEGIKRKSLSVVHEGTADKREGRVSRLTPV